MDVDDPIPVLNMHPNLRSENKCCVSRNKHYFISSRDCSKTLNLVMSDITPWSLLISEARFLYTLEYIPYIQVKPMHILMHIHAGYVLGWAHWMDPKGCPVQPPPSNPYTVTQVFTVKMRAICRESTWVGPFAFQLILEIAPVFLPCSQQYMWLK